MPVLERHDNTNILWLKGHCIATHPTGSHRPVLHRGFVGTVRAHFIF